MYFSYNVQYNAKLYKRKFEDHNDSFKKLIGNLQLKYKLPNNIVEMWNYRLDHWMFISTKLINIQTIKIFVPVYHVKQIENNKLFNDWDNSVFLKY